MVTTSEAIEETSAPATFDPFHPSWPELLRLPEWWGRPDSAAIKIEEFDENGSRVVRAEMPGIDPDKDVEMTVDHGMLTISAHRKEERRSDEDGYHRSEFRYGAFSRSVRLPAGATEEDVKATYVDGILEIRFPIDGRKAEATRIPISRT